MTKGRTIRFRVPMILWVGLLVAAVPAVGAATDPVPWDNPGGDPGHTGHRSMDFPMPNAPVDLGSFTAPGPVTSIVATDLDGDGDLDLVVGTGIESTGDAVMVTAYENDGGWSQMWQQTWGYGTPSSPNHGFVRLVAADMDGNGIAEIVATGNVRLDGAAVTSNDGQVWIYDPAGNMVGGGASTIGYDMHPTVADVDGDGLVEVIYVDEVGGTAPGIYLRALGWEPTALDYFEEWNFNAGTGTALATAAGDFNRSRPGLELAVGYATGTGAGNVRLCAPTSATANCTASVAAATGPYGAAVADMDSDGELEAIFNGFTGQSMSVVEVDATRTMMAGRVSTAGGWLWNRPTVGDIDRDGSWEYIGNERSQWIDDTNTIGTLHVATYTGSALTQVATLARNDPTQSNQNIGGAMANLFGVSGDRLEYVDISGSGRLSVYEFSSALVPSEAFSYQGTASRYGGAGVVLADVNNDCSDDIIAGFGDGEVVTFGDDTPRFVPDAPTSLQGVEGGTWANLTWAAPIEDGGRPVTEYKILRGLRGGPLAEIASVDATQLWFNDTTGPPFAARVDYQVVAVNCMGDSLPSNKLPLDVHEGPVEILNVLQTIVPEAQITLDDAMLRYADDLSGPSDVTFTITEAPEHGTLLYGVADPTPMAEPISFTMLDIIEGKVHYLHGSAAADDDSFSFVVADAHGKQAEAATFDIDVELITELTVVRNLGASVLQGTSIVISDELLELQDPAYAAGMIEFNLTGVPVLGDLRLDGVTLLLEDTFTMQDIADGRLVYHSTSVTGGDSFAFHAATPENELTGNFTINVEPLVSVAAAIGMPPAPYLIGQTYTFTDASAAGTYPIVAREWTLPDGTKSNAPSQSLKFSEPGVYTLKLTVYTSDGTDTVERTFEVIEYQPPQARFYSDLQRAEPGQKVTFWDRTIPGNSRIVRSEWDFKDAVPGTVDLTDQPVIAHAFTKPGKYIVSLRVQDEAGTVSIATHTILVEAPRKQSTSTQLPEADPQYPVADAGPDLVAVAGTVVRLDGKAESRTGRAVTVTWSHVTGAMLELRDADTPRPVFAVPHLLEGTSESVLEMAVHDGDLVSRDIVRIVLRNDGEPGPGALPAPTARFTFDIGTGGQVRFRSMDADLPSPRYEWDFGDGTTSTKAVPEHVYAEPGTYSVRLTLRDAMGREATFSQGLTLQSEAAAVPQDTDDGTSSKVGTILLSVFAGVFLVGAASLGLWLWLSRSPGQKR